MKIMVESTPTALWYKAIHQAQADCHIILKTDVESYLVLLVMRYINKPELVKEVIAPIFLQGMQLKNNQREVALQNVGDRCLLITGLFPALAERRQVKLSYFVDLGRVAYDVMSHKSNNDLFYKLSKQFVMMMDVLHSFRAHTADLLPLHAYELWEETGSQRAFQILQEYGTFPFKK